jgi:hypothetical protein
VFHPRPLYIAYNPPYSKIERLKARKEKLARGEKVEYEFFKDGALLTGCTMFIRYTYRKLREETTPNMFNKGRR